MGRQVLVACDDSPHSRVMVDVAFSHAVHRAVDEIHLATVVVPHATPVNFPMAPMASAAAVLAVHQGAEQQRAADVHKAQETLKLVSDLVVTDYHVPRDNIHTHVLASEGGASGVSEAVLHFAKDNKVDLLIVGNRGMGTIKRSLMSLVGLGSVSDALLNAAPCPVMLVRWDPNHPAMHNVEAEPAPLAPLPKKVCVCYDESPAADSALLWALDNILTAHDHLHIVTVALVAAFPILDEPAAVAALEAQTAQQQAESATAAAHLTVEKAVEIAVKHGVTRTKIIPVVLSPAMAANDIGASLCQHIKEKAYDVAVVGSRGISAFKRNLLDFVGLGSVSMHLAHHLTCALAVVREGSNPHESTGAGNLAFHVIPETDEGEVGDDSTKA